MAVNSGSSMFGCFPAVIVALLFGFLGYMGVQQAAVVPEAAAPVVATAVPQPQTGDAPSGRQSLTVIEQVEAEVSAGLPASVQLKVRGYQPDGCKMPVQVEQTRDGNSVTVKIFRIKPFGVMCTMELNPYSDVITLDGTFDKGTYTVDVNGTVITVPV